MGKAQKWRLARRLLQYSMGGMSAGGLQWWRWEVEGCGMYSGSRMDRFTDGLDLSIRKGDCTEPQVLAWVMELFTDLEKGGKKQFAGYVYGRLRHL